MVLGLLLLATKSDVVDQTLARIAASHEALATTVFRADSRAVVDGVVQEVKYEVSYSRPGDFVIKQTTVGAPDPVRVLSKSGNSLLVYDPRTKQFARRIFQGEVGVVEAVGASGFQIDDLVLEMIKPGGMPEWVEQFKKLSNWKMAQSNGNWRLTLTGGAGQVSLDVQASSGRLAGLHAKVGEKTTDWTITYPGGKYAAFAPPTGSFEVADIDPSLLNPTYADAGTRKAVEKMFRAYDKPRAMAVAVTTSDKKYRVWYRPGGVRQADGITDWSLVQGDLTVVDNRTTYRGRSTVRETIDRLPQTRSRAEPLTRALMRGQNYFRVILGNGEKVRTAGKTEIDKANCTILAATGKVAEYTLIVRDSDGYVLSLSTRLVGSKDPLGTDTSFVYMPTAGVVSGADLRVVGASATPRPISDLRLSRD